MLVAACIHDALRGTSAATGRRRAVAAGPATGAEDVDEMERQSPPFVAARAATTEDDVGGDAAHGATAATDNVPRRASYERIEMSELGQELAV